MTWEHSMADKIPYENLLTLLNPQKAGDHDWFLSLLDDEKQRAYSSAQKRHP